MSRLQTFRTRLQQLRSAFTSTRASDPRLVPLLAAVCLGVLLAVTALGALLGAPVFGGAFGVLLATLAGLLVFGWRTSKAAIRAIEGQPGAAAAVLQSMRGPWRVRPALAFNRRQDFVHLVVGRPGIVLVGEGGAARVAALLRQENRRITRAATDVPVTEVSVGDGPGQIPLPQLQSHLMRLPKVLKPAAVGPLDTRLSALASSEPPLPKGPLPRQRPKRR